MSATWNPAWPQRAARPLGACASTCRRPSACTCWCPRCPSSARYPGIQLEIGSSDRPVDLVAESVDCVIRGGDVHDESLVGRRLRTLQTATFASPDYLLGHGTPRHPDDLRAHALIGYFSSITGRTFSYDFSRHGERIEIDGPFHVAFNDANTFL